MLAGRSATVNSRSLTASVVGSRLAGWVRTRYTGRVQV